MLPVKPELVFVKVPMVAMLSLLSFISAAPIAASMEGAKPARRRPHPQGRNAEEDGRDAVFWSAAFARNGGARGKNCGKRSVGRCGHQAAGRLTSIMRGSVGYAANERRRWQRRRCEHSVAGHCVATPRTRTPRSPTRNPLK